MGTRDVTADHQFLATIDPAFDPRSRAFSGFVRAILAFGDHALKLLLPNGGKHIVCAGFELLRDSEERRMQLQKRLHEFAAVSQGKSGEIALLADEKIEDEIVNTRCFAAEVLEQVEVRSA